MGILHRASSLVRPLSSSSRRVSLPPRTAGAAVGTRSLCMPPGPLLRSGFDMSEAQSEDSDAFEQLKKCAADPADCDGITPEAALQELRRLSPELAQLAATSNTPTPVAPFTDVDPVTGEMTPKRDRLFNRAAI